MRGDAGGFASLRTALGVVWLLAAFVVGGLGVLLAAVSDWRDDHVAGWILVAIALLGGATAVVLLGGRPAWRLSLMVSVVFLVGGVVAAAVTTLDGAWFRSDLLLIAGIPVAAAVVTGLLAVLRRSAPGHRR
jgi:hypothetical protein